MPLVATREWFETLPKVWNSDPEKVKSLAGVHEIILLIIGDLPTPIAKLKEEIESGVVDSELLHRMEVENQAELLAEISDGLIKEFRFPKSGDKPTTILTGKYAGLEESAKGAEDLIWQFLYGELKLRGRLPSFTGKVDQFSNLLKTLLACTDWKR